MARVKSTDDWIEAGEYRVNPHKAKAYNVEFAEIAERLKASGASNADLAFLLGTSETNIKKWKREHPEFKRAINNGLSLTQVYLIGKGIKSAAGFTFTDRKITKRYLVKEDGSLELVPGSQVVIEEIEKTVPPNDRMLMFLLSCLDRQQGKEDWVAKQYIESKKEETIRHVIDAGSVADQIDKLSGRHVREIESVEVVDTKWEEPNAIQVRCNEEEVHGGGAKRRSRPKKSSKDIQCNTEEGPETSN